MGKSKKHKSEKKSKKKHKHKDHKEKKKAKKLKKETKQPKEKTDEKKKVTQTPPPAKDGGNAEELDNFAIPLELMNNKSHAPETPAEYQKRQSYIRRETDPVTGRIRLIKGDGEILEEIVSKDRHVDINKQATQGDGRYFQEKTYGSATKPKRK